MPQGVASEARWPHFGAGGFHFSLEGLWQIRTCPVILDGQTRTRRGDILAWTLFNRNFRVSRLIRFRVTSTMPLRNTRRCRVLAVKRPVEIHRQNQEAIKPLESVVVKRVRLPQPTF